MKRRFISVFVILSAMLLALTAFGQTPKPPAPAGEPIRIGGSLPLTGLWSETGRWVKIGYDYWVEDI